VITEEGGFEGDPDLAGLGVERLMDDALYAALPVDHPLATRRAIALTDLMHEDWMLVGLQGTCQDSNIVLRACAQAGFEPRVAYTSDDYFAIQGLVASGMGVALVPRLALASLREDVAVRPLRGRPPYRRIGAVFNGEAAGPLAVMLDCLRDAAESYRGAGPISAVAAA
jgi:DNA-binding transcriptional LysR family regulator